MESGNSPSKLLIIGATGTGGMLGQYIAKASVAAGHPTFVLVRTPSLSNPAKAALLDSYRELGITILEGSLEDHQSVVNALKQVDVVICTVSGTAIHTQLALLPAIKEAGTIKRFFPSDFGMDVDRVPLLPPIAGHLGMKSKIRQEIVKAGIPYTIVNNVGAARSFLASLFQHGRKAPPRDKVEIYGDGEGKISVIDEADIAAYTVMAIDDPRTLNKTLSIRPELIAPNEIVAIWEKNLGYPLEKIYVSREELMKQIKELASEPLVPGPGGAPPMIAVLCTRVAIFIEAAFSVKAAPNYVEVHDLYPDYKFITVDKYLDQFV
ncbi:unnamed protein product [Calypogeia fissa]